LIQLNSISIVGAIKKMNMNTSDFNIYSEENIKSIIIQSINNLEIEEKNLIQNAI